MVNPPDEFDTPPGIPSGVPADALPDLPPGADLAELGIEPAGDDQFGFSGDASPADFGITGGAVQSDTQALLGQLSRLSLIHI